MVIFQMTQSVSFGNLSFEYIDFRKVIEQLILFFSLVFIEEQKRLGRYPGKVIDCFSRRSGYNNPLLVLLGEWKLAFLVFNLSAITFFYLICREKFIKAERAEINVDLTILLIVDTFINAMTNV